MSEPPIDLTPLDPTRDPARFDRLVGAIVAEAQPELARRLARATPMGQIARWSRPMLAAAAVIVIASVTILSQVGAPVAAATDSGYVAEALGVPAGLAEWVLTDALPTPSDLVATLGEAP